jgi:hypothetical protein
MIKQNLLPVTASSLVLTFWVIHYIRVKKYFHSVDFMGIKINKNAEFYVDLKNLPWRQNAPKKVIPKNMVNYDCYQKL